MLLIPCLYQKGILLDENGKNLKKLNLLLLPLLPSFLYFSCVRRGDGSCLAFQGSSEVGISTTDGVNPWQLIAGGASVCALYRVGVIVVRVKAAWTRLNVHAWSCAGDTMDGKLVPSTWDVAGGVSPSRFAYGKTQTSPRCMNRTQNEALELA